MQKLIENNTFKLIKPHLNKNLKIKIKSMSAYFLTSKQYLSNIFTAYDQ